MYQPDIPQNAASLMRLGGLHGGVPAVLLILISVDTFV